MFLFKSYFLYKRTYLRILSYMNIYLYLVYIWYMMEKPLKQCIIEDNLCLMCAKRLYEYHFQNTFIISIY